MSHAIVRRRVAFRRSAWVFLGIAVATALGLGALQIAGARECTVVLSGGVPAGHGIESAAALGGLYTIAWLAAVALAPPFAVSALVLFVVGFVSRRREGTSGDLSVLSD